MLDQHLHLEQRQTLSARQVQQIQLLELPIMELEQRIRSELERNPALEEDYTQSSDTHPDTEEQIELEREELMSDYMHEDDIPSYRLNALAQRERMREEIPFATHGQSLLDYLEEQISTLELTEDQRLIMSYLIGNLREDGYLERDIALVSQDLILKEGLDVPPSEIEAQLRLLQSLDPPGVGARSLQECLLLQLNRLPESYIRRVAHRIIDNYFEDFVNRRFERLLNRGFDRLELEEAMLYISELNPKPGNGFDSSLGTLLGKVTPDFLVTNIEGELQLSLTDQREIPSLKISPTYRSMLEEYRTASAQERKRLREAIKYTRERINEAEWFMGALQQRFDTLRTTMLVIMTLQRDFFLSGDVADLRPMILKDVAELTHLDISTVSRVSNSKYVQCDWGIYPLKYFFSEAMVNKEGIEVSTRIIKDSLLRIIEAEPPTAPWTDDQLVRELAKQGYEVARRTIAKYRKQLNIPTARLRRKL